jgi:hypothetical protein
MLVAVAPAAADTLDFHFDDPVGDHTGIVDVVRMDFTFDDATGAYTIVLTADPANPFVGEFRININLFYPDTGTTARNPSYFGDTGNDFNLSSPGSTIELTGTRVSLMQWVEGDRVATSDEPFGNFDCCSRWSEGSRLPLFPCWRCTISSRPGKLECASVTIIRLEEGNFGTSWPARYSDMAFHTGPRRVEGLCG